MQTFVQFGILSDWGWKNDPLPQNETIDDYHGVLYPSHGRCVSMTVALRCIVRGCSNKGELHPRQTTITYRSFTRVHVRTYTFVHTHAYTLTIYRLVPYDDTDPKLPLISDWLYNNPNRMNLGQIGLDFPKYVCMYSFLYVSLCCCFSFCVV